MPYPIGKQNKIEKNRSITEHKQKPFRSKTEARFVKNRRNRRGFSGKFAFDKQVKFINA